jgi:phosphatidylethanolamine/phosphatidyl-N-methylethanolamine N-methyltransferase
LCYLMPMKAKLKHFFSLPASDEPRRKNPQFLAAWARSPLKIGSLTPSSKSLARAMAKQVDLSENGVIVEIGAGTGAVTHALLEAKIPNDRLLIVEREPRLFAILHVHFPQLRIVRADAVELDDVLKECGVGQVCAVVSSLPLLSMPRGVRTQIEERMAAAIHVGGKIIQFTYGPISPIAQDRWRSLGIYGKRVQFVVSNVPPAHVWVYMRDRRIQVRKT